MGPNGDGMGPIGPIGGIIPGGGIIPPMGGFIPGCGVAGGSPKILNSSVYVELLMENRELQSQHMTIHFNTAFGLLLQLNVMLELGLSLKTD